MPDQEKPWIVAVGASGGQGLLDIQELLAAFPRDLSAVIMVVLHRGWGMPTQLQSILAKGCNLPVVIAAQSEHFETGTVYIGEPSEHLTLAGRSFGGLVNDPHRRYRNRTIDLLFTSVAQHAGTRMIGVVLSGALDDGSRGLAAIHHAGGLTMVLTPDVLAVRGMPENAIKYDGVISLIGDPRRIADGICKACAG